MHPHTNFSGSTYDFSFCIHTWIQKSKFESKYRSCVRASCSLLGRGSVHQNQQPPSPSQTSVNKCRQTFSATSACVCACTHMCVRACTHENQYICVEHSSAYNETILMYVLTRNLHFLGPIRCPPPQRQFSRCRSSL